MELPGRLELMMSVYCPNKEAPALNRAKDKLQRIVDNL
jgi:hypothetical protein